MEINLPMSAPVNNITQGNAYDKLDAVTFEKVRQANSLLDSRRSIQEKMINKYRKDVEKVHMHQKERLRREYRKIRTKKPDYVFDGTDTKDRSQETDRPRSLSDSSDGSFCRRYYAHHYHIKDRTKQKKEQEQKKEACKNNDYFNMTLRIFFVNMMNNSRGQLQNNHAHDEHQELPPISHKDAESVKIKPHSYDPRFMENGEEKTVVENRAQSVETWVKAQDEECDELKELIEYSEEPENDVFDSSLNASKFSLDSSSAWTQLKPKLSRSMNSSSCTSIAEESKMGTKEDKELWKKSKRAFEKIFAGLL